MAETPPARPGPSPRLVVALCSLAIGLGSGPGFLFGYLAPSLMSEFGFERSGLGLLVGLFFGGTGVASTVAASWGSRLGARACVSLNMAVVAATTALMALAGSYFVLAVGAVLGGAAYAFGNVGTNMAVAAVTAPGRAGVALTVKTAGVPLVAAALAWMAASAETTGWRPLAWVLAATATVVAVLATRVLPPAAVRLGRRRGPEPLPRHFWLLPLAAFLFVCGSQPLQSFLVVFLHEATGLSLPVAARTVGVATLLGVAAMVLAARWADRVGRAGRSRFVAVICGLGALTGAVLALVEGHVVLGVLAGLVGVCCNLAAAGLTHAVVVERSPGAVGRGSGLTLAGYYLGALVSPLAFGVLADRTGGYAVGWGASAVLLTLAALLYWLVHHVIPVGAAHRDG